MRYIELHNAFRSKRGEVQEIFTYRDVVQRFPAENIHTCKSQLKVMTKRGDLIKIKRGWYSFRDSRLDPVLIGAIIHCPYCYLSAETVLMKYKMLTKDNNGKSFIKKYASLSTHVASKQIIKHEFKSHKFNPYFKNQRNTHKYKYSRISSDLFFGYKERYDQLSGHRYYEAELEKALLDHIYLQNPWSPDVYDWRYLSEEDFDYELYQEYSKRYPLRVRNFELL